MKLAGMRGGVGNDVRDTWRETGSSRRGNSPDATPGHEVRRGERDSDYRADWPFLFLALGIFRRCLDRGCDGQYRWHLRCNYCDLYWLVVIDIGYIRVSTFKKMIAGYR